MSYFLHQRDHAKSPVKRFQGDRNYFLCLLGFNTAFRAEDLLQLRVLDVIDGYMTIKENKTGKVQNFKINRLLLDDIQGYVERNDLKRSDYLYLGQKNGHVPISRQHGDEILKEAVKAVKLPQKFSMHAMRKTFGYQYIKNGGKPGTLCKMYNHDSISTTELYICWGTEDAEADRESIYLGGVHRKGKRA